jgi:hypothetical protein
MKKLLLIILLFQTGSLFAQGGKIHISSTCGRSFTLYVCNIQYNIMPATDLMVYAENEQTVSGRIVMNDSIGYSFYIALEPRANMTADYIIEKIRPHHGQMVYGYQLYLDHYDRNDHHRNDRVEREQKDYRQDGKKQRDEFKPRPDQKNAELITFRSDEFDQYADAVKAQGFESSSLTVAEDGLNSRLITTDQVLKIMNLFSYESTKLQYAEYALSHLVDRPNNYLIYKGFGYSSTIEEYKKYCDTH